MDYKNLELAEKNLTHASLASVPVQDLGHFILWQRPEVVVREIVSYLGSAHVSEPE